MSILDTTELAMNTHPFLGLEEWPANKYNPLDELTPTQLDATGLAALGYSRHEVADRMGITGYTARDHFKAAKDAFSVDTRVQLGAVSAQAGIFSRATNESWINQKTGAMLQATEIAMAEVKFKPIGTHLPIDELKPLQQEVLKLLVDKGMENPGIAVAIDDSHEIVKKCMAAIFDVLGVRDRHKAVFIVRLAQIGKVVNTEVWPPKPTLLD